MVWIQIWTDILFVGPILDLNRLQRFSAGGKVTASKEGVKVWANIRVCVQVKVNAVTNKTFNLCPDIRNWYLNDIIMSAFNHNDDRQCNDTDCVRL